MILFGANAQLASLRDRKRVESRASRAKSSPAVRNRKRHVPSASAIHREEIAVRREPEEVIDPLSEPSSVASA
jgi:hypothetical protein